MEYVTKTCPHCKKQMTFMEKRRYDYGSKLVICKNCQNPVIDDSIREIELEGISFRDKLPVDPGIILYLSISLFLLFVIISNNMFFEYLIFSIIALGFSLLMLYALITSIKSQGEKKKWLEEEAKASHERLRDPTYCLLLKQSGYNLPRDWLTRDLKK